MVNKLRLVARGGGSTLLLVTAWAALHYGPERGYLPFLGPAVLAVAVMAIPVLGAHAKLWWHNAREWWEGRGGYSFERGSLLLSEESIGEREALLDDVTAAVEDTEGYDDVKRDEFPEGDGLTVTHAGFHNSFLRVTGAGRVLVTGASERSRDLADLLEERFGLTMEPSRFHPFLEPTPIRGAPRVFLSVFLVVGLVVGLLGVGGAAYPSSAYNPAEKVVLVGFDARGDAPGVDQDQVRLQKAAFLVDVVNETAVEIAWEQNSSARIASHARSAVAVSDDTNRLLNETLRHGDPAERRRARAIRADLHDAQRRVARSIATRNRGNVSGDLLTRMHDVLTNRSRTGTTGA